MESLSDKLNRVPKIEFLKDRFTFINNKDLQTNLSISFQYVIFLITIQEEITLQGPVSYSIFKNIISNTAAIVEGALHHLIDRLIKDKGLDPEKVLRKEQKYFNKKILFKTDYGTEICGVHFIEKPSKLKSTTNFQEIIRACKRAKILDNDLFNEVEDLRQKVIKFI